MEVQSEQQNNSSEEHGPQAQVSVEDASVNVGTASNNVEATSTAEVQVSTVPGKKLFFCHFRRGNMDSSLLQILLQKFRPLKTNMLQVTGKDLKIVMRTRRRSLKNLLVEDTTNVVKLSNIGSLLLSNEILHYLVILNIRGHVQGGAGGPGA